MAKKKKKKAREVDLSTANPHVAKRYYHPYSETQEIYRGSDGGYMHDFELAKKGLKSVRCERCGKIFTVKRKNNKTVLCPDCQAERKREKDRERKRRQRERAGMNKGMSYWEQRVHHDFENSRKELTSSAEVELMFVYKDAQEDIETEITAVLAKIEDMKAKGEPILMNDLYREKRYVELFRHLNKKITEVWDDWGSTLSSTIMKSYEEARRIIDEDAEPVKGTPVDAQLSNIKAIDGRQIINQTWCLDGKKFSDRVWANKDKMLLRLKKALGDCIVRGKSPYESAKEMCKVLDAGLRECYRLVRTETAHAQVIAQTEKYKEYGFTHGKFLASATCCEKCHEHDGEIFSLDELEKMLPVHPNCTCTYTLVKPKKAIK